jgi:hypothetical protein
MTYDEALEAFIDDPNEVTREMLFAARDNELGITLVQRNELLEVAI